MHLYPPNRRKRVIRNISNCEQVNLYSFFTVVGTLIALNQIDLIGSISTSSECVYISLLFSLFKHVNFLKSCVACTTSIQCPELAIYVETDIKVVEHESLCLHEVMVKLKLEMKEAMDTEG